MFTALLSTLAAIAGSLALDRVIRAIDTVKAKKDGVSSDDVLKIVKTATSEARQKGNDVYNQLINRLNASPQLLGMSPSLKSYLVKEKNKLNTEVLDTQRNLQAVENKLSNIEERASNYAYQDAATRRLLSDVPSKLVKETEQIASQIENKL